ncbi:UNVERIFIED_ORG: hypothetical protein M2438_001919 [Methylobacterium sp. SuP10 SLI 274]|uniref:hypothetical protein n=1 Tax=Methylorubrum extorquens TaxID=408 RepID=UPI0020A03A7F|nr:hypothetical protein [Methylorubrum extorquens]MDF9863132.1 hypothetical protein [Methylorubrum pseudosasae]MDH6636744.1 hypothetical protein [Methylobacterium sp. SuP10 SLI 274]MDH6665921.1 hypothetical protein [Methylorubrum zatmanii]MCP1557835.1 hypothetical protein [Methylorubrum extorquens]MDF9791437.1 hypothetical protein [Methylorubrum extorquens]
MGNEQIDIGARLQEIDDKVDGLIAYIALVAGKLEVDHDTEGFRNFIRDLCRPEPHRNGSGPARGFAAAQAFHKVEEARQKAVQAGLIKED